MNTMNQRTPAMQRHANCDRCDALRSDDRSDDSGEDKEKPADGYPWHSNLNCQYLKGFQLKSILNNYVLATAAPGQLQHSKSSIFKKISIEIEAVLTPRCSWPAPTLKISNF